MESDWKMMSYFHKCTSCSQFFAQSEASIEKRCKECRWPVYIVVKCLHRPLKLLICVVLALKLAHGNCGECTVYQQSDCDYCGAWFDYEPRKLFCSRRCAMDYAGATNNSKRFNLTLKQKTAWERKKFQERELKRQSQWIPPS